MRHNIVRHSIGDQKSLSRASLVVQGRMHLAVQGTLVQSMVQEIPHAVGQLSLCAAATEAHAPRPCAPQ